MENLLVKLTKLQELIKSGNFPVNQYDNLEFSLDYFTGNQVQTPLDSKLIQYLITGWHVVENIDISNVSA